MLSELLRPWSEELSNHFTDVPVPVAFGGDLEAPDPHPFPDLGHAGTRVVILAGPGAMLDRPSLHALAQHLGTPVANTWGAKGIYPWDDPYHMGTCGLQRDDFELLGFADFDLILAIGIDPAESPTPRFALTEVAFISPLALDELRSQAEPRLSPSFTPNQLSTRLAAIAQPGYLDDSSPRHPARAVMDLKRSLGPGTRVTAQPGLAGLWVARTFPTDRMGSVIVAAHDRPGIGAAIGLISAAEGTDTVCVVQGPVDATTEAVMEVCAARALPLRLEIWNDDIDWSRTKDLIAAAGPVVAWT